MSDAELRRLEREAASGDEEAITKLEAARRRLGVLLPWEDTNYVGKTYEWKNIGHRLESLLESLRRCSTWSYCFGSNYGEGSARLHLLKCFEIGRIPEGVLILRPKDIESRNFFGHMQYENNDYIVVVFSVFHGQNDDKTSKHYGHKWTEYGMYASIGSSTETIGDRYFDISIEWVAQYALEHDIPLRTGTVSVSSPNWNPKMTIELDAD